MSRTRNANGRALTALTAASLALAACNPLSIFAPTHEEVRAKGWLFPTQDRTPILADPADGFCYRTLAEIDCYSDPVPGAESRLVADPPILSAPATYRR